MTESPFFVVGTQRSGTTLLYQILNNHADLFCVNECHSLYPYFASDTPDPKGLREVLQWRCKLDSGFWDNSVTNSAKEMVTAAFTTAAKENGALRWGIKDPQMTYFLDSLHSTFPEAKFLVIYRDPRAVCSSYLRTQTVSNVYAGAQLWSQEIQLQRAFVNANPESTLWLQYEYVLDHFDDSLKEVCSFFEIEPTSEMQNYYQQPSTAKIHQGNVNITKPIQPQKKQEWKKQLSKKQIGVIQSVCSPLMKELGYEEEPANQEVSKLQATWYRVQERVMQEYWWQRRSGWYGIRRRIGLLNESEKNHVAVK